MARLRKCKSCGNMVARDAKRCPQCGGKVNKSHGCLMIIILMIVIFVAAKISLPNSDVPSTSNNDAPKTENPNSPENADAFQVDYFSNDGAELFAQNFLEKKLNTIVSIKLKFTSPAKITKFSDVAPEFAKHVQNNKKKIGTSVNVENVWVVEQKFCDTDNREEEASYYALVEFKKGAGYRVIFMSVNNKQIFP